MITLSSQILPFTEIFMGKKAHKVDERGSSANLDLDSTVSFYSLCLSAYIDDEVKPIMLGIFHYRRNDE
jgi:hypothetical protein